MEKCSSTLIWQSVFYGFGLLLECAWFALRILTGKSKPSGILISTHLDLGHTNANFDFYLGHSIYELGHSISLWWCWHLYLPLQLSEDEDDDGDTEEHVRLTRLYQFARSVRALLHTYHYNQIFLSEFCGAFSKYTGQEFQPQTYGYKTLDELLAAIPQVP